MLYQGIDYGTEQMANLLPWKFKKKRLFAPTMFEQWELERVTLCNQPHGFDMVRMIFYEAWGFSYVTAVTPNSYVHLRIITNIWHILLWEVAKWSVPPWCNTFYKESLRLEKQSWLIYRLYWSSRKWKVMQVSGLTFTEVAWGYSV